MGRRQMKTPRLTRREKLLQERKNTQVAQAETTQAEYMPPISVQKLEAKTPNQATAVRLLREKRVVFLTGSAGTGKSLLSAHAAANLLRAKVVEKIYLVRPAVATGKSVGLLPGELKEKLAPYFAQTIEHLEKFLGKGYTNYCLEKGIIEMKAVEYLRGSSFEKIAVITEESQNFTEEQFEMLITRIGAGTRMYITGDTKQNDLKGESGLQKTIDLLDRMLQTQPEYLDDEDLDNMDDGYGHVEFKPVDVVRDDITRAFVKMYYHNT